MKLLYNSTCIVIILFFSLFPQTNYGQENQLAFPTAKGAGAYATGGRGGIVVHVTNLNDSGPGSLREALNMTVPRTIVFDVSGVITIDALLYIDVSNSNFTLAGQTAPEGGITIDGGRVYFRDVDNYIMRYVRFKGGIDADGFPNSGDGNGSASFTTGVALTNAITDHCSFGFGKTMPTWYSSGGDGSDPVHSATIQNCLFSETFKGAIIGKNWLNGGNLGSMTFRNNLFYNTKYRFPNIGGFSEEGTSIDVINNIAWSNTGRLMRCSGDLNLNHIGNSYYFGPLLVQNTGVNLWADEDFSPQIYTANNTIFAGAESSSLSSSVAEMNADNRLSWHYFVGPNYGDQLPMSYFTSTQFPLKGENYDIITDTSLLKEQLVDNVGCNARLNADGSVSDNLDVLDASYLANVANNIFVPGLGLDEYIVPNIPSVARPSDYYQSNPHIPDPWFTDNVPPGEDHNDIAPSGYTWMEEFLNQVDYATIEEILPESVAITPELATMEVNETLQLTLTYTPSNTTNQNGIWESSDTSIVSVDNSGLVTALMPGDAVITYTSSQDTSITSESQITVFAEALEASAGEDQEICEGETITLTASGGPNFLWDTGETTASIDVTPLTTTTYTVTVFDDNGNFDEDSVTITVNPIPVANASDDIEICTGETVTLVASGGDTYLWSTGETTATIDVNPDSNTIYTVEVTTNECSSTDEVLVTVNDVPDIVVTDDVVILEGDSTTLGVSGGDNYLWSTGETTPFITVNPLTTTTYTVTSNGLNGCSTTEEVIVTVIPEVVADAGNDATICAGDTITLTATGGTSYLWDTGDTTAELVVAPQSTTTYTVTVTDDYGFSDSDSVTITVNETPDITVSDDVAILEGESVTLIAAGGDNYQWNTGDTTDSITVSPLVTTTYTVISIAVGGCADIEQVTVTIIPEVVAEAGDDVTLCSGETVTLNATGGATYLWDTGDTTAELIVSPTTTTTYTVTVTDDYGYSDTDSVTVTVNETPDISVSNDETIFEGESIILNASGGNNYLWSTGETTETIQVSPTTTTTYTVTSTNANCEDTESITVTVIPEVEADAGEDVTICNGESATLNASGGTSYLWNTGATTSELIVNPSITTTYTVTVTDDFGFSDTDTVTVTVNELPVVTITDDVTIVLGETISLVANGADSYQWNNGVTINTIVVSPNTTTTYTVVGTTNSCSAVAEVTVTVEGVFEADAGEDERVCEDDNYEVLLTATSGDSYLWSTGETTQSILVSPSSTTTYTVTVTEGIQEDTDNVTVYVDPNPDVVIVNGDSVDIMDGDFVTLSATGANTYEWNNGATQPNIAVSPSVTTTYEVRGYVGDCFEDKQVTVNVVPEVIADAGEDVEICLGDTITLTATGGNDYVWSNGETTQSIQVSPTETTEYTVTVFNELDFDEDTVTVFVNENCEDQDVGPIDTIDPGNGEPVEFNFSVFPNPASDIINIRLGGSTALSRIYLYDVTGKLIHSEIITNESLSMTSNRQVDISRLHPGMYYVRLVDIRQDITRRIIKN